MWPGRMTLRGKLLLLVLVPVLGLVWYSGRDGQREYQELKEVLQARDLFVATRHLDSLADALAAERGRTFAFSGTGQARFHAHLEKAYAETDRALSGLRADLEAEDWVRDALPEIWARYRSLDHDLKSLVRRREARRNPRIRKVYQGMDEMADYSRLLLDIADLKSGVSTLVGSPRLVELGRPYEEIQELMSAMRLERVLGAWVLAHRELPIHIGIDLLQTNQRIRIGEQRLGAMAGYLDYQAARPSEFAALNLDLFSHVIEEVDDYLVRISRFRTLQSELGYGGLIHLFKNHVLRGDARYRLLFEDRFAALESELTAAERDEGLASETRERILRIRETFATYGRMLDEVDRLRGEGTDLAELDRKIRVNDEDALSAIEYLYRFELPLSAEEWFREQSRRIALYLDVGSLIRDDMLAHLEQRVTDQRLFLLQNLLLTLVLLALSFYILAWIYRDTLQSLGGVAGAVDEIATRGHLDVVLPQARADEVGDLVRSMQSLVNNTHVIIAKAERIGGGDYSVVVEPRSQEDQLALALNSMVDNLRTLSAQRDHDAAIKERLVQLSNILRSGSEEEESARQVLEYLCEQGEALTGVFYLPAAEAGFFEPACAHGIEMPRLTGVRLGHGIVGQVMASRIPFFRDGLTPDYLALRSGTGAEESTSLLVLPLWERDACLGAVEIGRAGPFHADFVEFIEQAQEPLALGIQALRRRRQLEAYVRELDARRKALEERESQLREINVELTAQAESLQASEEELRVANEDLEESSRSLRESHERLAEQAEELEKASQYKSEFLANMSHELRTPLNSILIVSQAFAENRDGNLTSEQQESAQLIESSGRSLLELINDILDLSKVEAGKLEVVPGEMNVRDFVAELHSMFLPQAQHKGISLEVEWGDDVPASWYSDAHRASQIVRNFLSNAVKFTREGSVTLRVSHDPDALPANDVAEPVPGQLRFDVIDTGVGIEPDHMERVFESFQQADGSISREFGGTGLGLSISSRLATLLGAQISAESVRGEGSTFSLTLPRLKAADGAAPQGPPPPASSSEAEAFRPESPVTGEDADLLAEFGPLLNERKIVLADDDLRNCFALSSELRRFGMYVLLAKDGRQCLEKLQEHADVEAVIMDLMMPVMDGYEALERIRADQRHGNLPVVLLTARNLDADAQSARDKGASAFLIKPVELEDMVRTLAEIFAEAEA